MCYRYTLHFSMAEIHYLYEPKKKISYSVPEAEEKILQILTENKGKSLSRLALIRKVNFPGSFGEFKTILNQLWKEDKIKRVNEDYPKYYVN